MKYAANKERVTIDEFVDSVGKQRFDPDLIKCDKGLIHAFFTLMDLNCDGYVQEDEFERIYTQFGVPDRSWTKETFQAIDYFYSDDENSPYKHFFGPLVD